MLYDICHGFDLLVVLSRFDFVLNYSKNGFDILITSSVVFRVTYTLISGGSLAMIPGIKKQQY